MVTSLTILSRADVVSLFLHWEARKVHTHTHTYTRRKEASRGVESKQIALLSAGIRQEEYIHASAVMVEEIKHTLVDWITRRQSNHEKINVVRLRTIYLMKYKGLFSPGVEERWAGNGNAEVRVFRDKNFIFPFSPLHCLPIYIGLSASNLDSVHTLAEFPWEDNLARESFLYTAGIYGNVCYNIFRRRIRMDKGSWTLLKSWWFCEWFGRVN